MTLGYHAFGGKGFENNSYSQFNWNSMVYSPQDIGGALGNMASGWVLNNYGIDKDTGVRTGSSENDSWFDKAVSSLYEGSIKIDNGIKGFFNNVGKMVGDGVRDFAQSTCNLFARGKFMNDDQLSLYDNMQNGNYLKAGSIEYYKNKLDLGYVLSDEEKRNFDEQMSKMPKIDRIRVLAVQSAHGFMNDVERIIIDSASFQRPVEEIVNTVNTKIRNGQQLSNDELALFMDTIQQQAYGTISKQVAEQLKNNPNLFDRTNKDATSNYKIDFNDANSVLKFSNHIGHGACVLATAYAQLVLSGVEGVPDSFGAFYKKLYETKASNGNYIIDYLNQRTSTQDLVDKVVGVNKIQVIGYGNDLNHGFFKDENGNITNGYSGKKLYEKLINTAANNDFIYATVRKNNGVHNMILKNENGNLAVWDTGLAHRGQHRPYGAPFEEYVSKYNIQSFYYLKKRSYRR
jgi:hypothetical protein